MSSTAPKHAAIGTWLRERIQSGRLPAGARLPTEVEVMQRFGVSRITVTRAMRDLQTAGLIERRVGAGSFVAARPRGRSFGLLIPDLGETDVFEPICQGMMASPLARDHALVWGSVPDPGTGAGARAWHLCSQLISRHVDGVFFAPLEFGPDRHDVNTRIVAALDEASIPTVLLDRTVSPYPDAGHHDLVTIDNRQAGYVMTRHLLGCGSARVAFVARSHALSTIDAREWGYRDAVRLEATGTDAMVVRLDVVTDEVIDALMRRTPRPDGIVCANDRTAGEVLHALGRLGWRVPADVRLAGIDDVGYAELLPVPLTTFRQPAAALGETALGVMLDRIGHPDRPPRDTLLHGQLIVRASCGSASST